jgi:protein-disulfide isomerase
MKRELLIPAAIVFAGFLAAICIYTIRHGEVVALQGNPEAARPVSTSDHILGNPAAPITIIEYGDIGGQYSKDFQQVMDEVMQNYGAGGNVAWVYRQFPVGDTDPNSGEHAEASECVAALGNNADFFKFIDALEAAAPADTPFNPTGYDSIVSTLGISTGSFDDCLASHVYQGRVRADFENAELVGGTGAPYTIIFIKGQKPITIAGSVPYATMKQILDAEIQKILSAK